jgi:NAD(P)-dependent dehydrogenase (short-subunit alcohol dehydrogenase family)
MIRQGFGQIVNTASMAGLAPAPIQLSYTATKHAVVGLSRALRVEAKRHGVRVSVLWSRRHPHADTSGRALRALQGRIRRGRGRPAHGAGPADGAVRLAQRVPPGIGHSTITTGDSRYWQ